MSRICIRNLVQKFGCAQNDPLHNVENLTDTFKYCLHESLELCFDKVVA